MALILTKHCMFIEIAAIRKSIYPHFLIKTIGDIVLLKNYVASKMHIQFFLSDILLKYI